MSIKVIPYLVDKMKHRPTIICARRSSSYKRVDDEVNLQMKINCRNNKKSAWRKPASVFFNMFGTGNNRVTQRVQALGAESKKRFQRAMKAERTGRQIGAFRWFRHADDTVAATAEKRSASGSRMFWKVDAGRNKPRLMQRISIRKQLHKEPKGPELCKRRILMGVKCKPFNASGKLHYDRDGVILAEDDEAL
uniref:Uncharacterized protein n=1 Tax=Kalanchoe fedtschenkoi TaxID=63787 RepID=A0A7N0ZU11_KALFE